MTICMREIDGVEAVHLLHSGDIDLAFARLEGDLGSGIKSMPLREDRLAVALPREHPQSARSRIRLASLAEEDFVMFYRRLSPDQPRAKAHVQWVPDTAVPHWSPRRSWLTVNLADCDDTILSGHPAAGAHGKGSRPKRWQPAINTSFDNMRAAKENKVHRLHGKGRNLVILTDENDFDIPDIHPRVKTVFHKWSDYGQVIPTRGYGAEFRAGEVVPIGLDSHSGRLMHGRFVKR